MWWIFTYSDFIFFSSNFFFGVYMWSVLAKFELYHHLVINHFTLNAKCICIKCKAKIVYSKIDFIFFFCVRVAVSHKPLLIDYISVKLHEPPAVYYFSISQFCERQWNWLQELRNHRQETEREKKPTDTSLTCQIRKPNKMLWNPLTRLAFVKTIILSLCMCFFFGYLNRMHGIPHICSICDAAQSKCIPIL